MQCRWRHRRSRPLSPSRLGHQTETTIKNPAGTANLPAPLSSLRAESRRARKHLCILWRSAANSPQKRALTTHAQYGSLQNGVRVVGHDHGDPKDDFAVLRSKPTICRLLPSLPLHWLQGMNDLSRNSVESKGLRCQVPDAGLASFPPVLETRRLAPDPQHLIPALSELPGSKLRSTVAATRAERKCDQGSNKRQSPRAVQV